MGKEMENGGMKGTISFIQDFKSLALKQYTMGCTASNNLLFSKSLKQKCKEPSLQSVKYLLKEAIMINILPIYFQTVLDCELKPGVYNLF